MQSNGRNFNEVNNFIKEKLTSSLFLQNKFVCDVDSV